MEGEDGPLKLQSSSEDNLLIPWTTLGRCGKPKERFVPSYEALGLQNVNYSICHGDTHVESNHGQTIAGLSEGMVNLPLLGEVMELVKSLQGMKLT